MKIWLCARGPQLTIKHRYKRQVQAGLPLATAAALNINILMLYL